MVVVCPFPSSDSCSSVMLRSPYPLPSMTYRSESDLRIACTSSGVRWLSMASFRIVGGLRGRPLLCGTPDLPTSLLSEASLSAPPNAVRRVLPERVAPRPSLIDRQRQQPATPLGVPCFGGCDRE